MGPFDYLEAARVPHSLQPQTFGPWTIRRMPASYSPIPIGWDDYTLLHRMTEDTLLHEPGEVVMEDSIRELRRHLPIWLAARGRILVTGLGLGCVVRGLLASPHVEHIDVIEIDCLIIRAVGAEFADNPRVEIHHGDALAGEWHPDISWDFAWHDIWCEGSGLQRLHVELLSRYRKRVGSQGAWMLPRFVGRVWRDPLLGVRRRRTFQQRRAA